MYRTQTKQIHVGSVAIGGGAPVAVQSMCNTHTSDARATIEQIARLHDAGCEIIRLAVPDQAAADVLPEIADAVGGRVKILVDGGIRSGTDIFRALALGADAVMICRPFLISYYGGGTEGIVAYVETLRAELTDAMYMCGARCLSDITRDMVREVR